VNDEIVYVLTNPAMPGLIKIGVTSDDVEKRLGQLYTTSIPVPFECAFACQVEDAAKVEEALHMAFRNTRVNPKREFFKIEPESVIAILGLLSIKDVTPQIENEMTEGLDSIDKESRESLERSRRPSMNFELMNILPGATLLFEDGITKVTVVDDRRVNYQGQTCFLTSVTKELLKAKWAVQPAPHWTYEGRSIKEIYEETYSEDER